MLHRLLTLVALLVVGPALASEYSLPARVKVLPVAFVPKDQVEPTGSEQKQFLRHIEWSQKRYREMLGDTFELAEEAVKVVPGQKPLDFYRAPPERGAPDIVSELLTHLKLTRFNCPYVFCILLMNSKDSFPEGGGRSINGGINTGGGMMYIASWQLARSPNFQTTLQHELGHAFGLPHVDVYGYDMKSNASIMSYNPTHHANGFEASKTPGTLIPEDRRALALNDRVFAKTTFDPKRDVPAKYELSKRIIPLGPMNLPGQPDFYPRITTTAGEEMQSKVINIVREQTKLSDGVGNTYDPSTMWHSRPLADKKGVLEITFPSPVELTGIGIHTQHSAAYHAAEAMKLEAIDGETRQVVIEKPLKSVDETVTFPQTKSSRWSLTLTAGTTPFIVVRGLRFFNGQEEVCPHMVPFAAVANAGQSSPEAMAAPAESAASSEEKKAVPDAATVETARKAVKEQFKAELAKARKPDGKTAVARTFVEQAESSSDDAQRFALLTEAIQFAAQGGDLDLALQIVKTLSDQFVVSALSWKEKAATAAGSATLTLGYEEATVLLAKFVAIAEEAAAADEYVMAVNVMKAAGESLKKPALKPLKDDTIFLVKHWTAFREAFDTARNARDKLQSNPDDPVANLTWGRFVCFYKQDWDNGLKLLAKANDKVWAPLAERELNPPKTANDWLQLGDDWLQAGIREKDQIKFHVGERADRAWEQAVATAAQLQKKEIEQKVDQRIVKLFGSTFAASRGDAAGAAIPGSDRFSPTDTFTIEFWMATTSAKGTLLSKRQSSEDSSIIVHLDGTEANLSVAQGGGEGGSGGGPPLNDGKWHHLAVVKQMDEVVLYVDGEQATKTTLKAALQSRSPWKFGTSNNRAPCAARFGGIRISKVARYQDSFTPKKLHAKDKDTLYPQ